jgi:predicted RNase H-like HicB family nuclease
MHHLYDYTVVTRPDDNGTYVAYVPAIPGCHAIGNTPEEASAELADVFAMIVEEYAEEGRPLPPDVRSLVAHAG